MRRIGLGSVDITGWKPFGVYNDFELRSSISLFVDLPLFRIFNLSDVISGFDMHPHKEAPFPIRVSRDQRCMVRGYADTVREAIWLISILPSFRLGPWPASNFGNVLKHEGHAIKSIRLRYTHA